MRHRFECVLGAPNPVLLCFGRSFFFFSPSAVCLRARFLPLCRISQSDCSCAIALCLLDVSGRHHLMRTASRRGQMALERTHTSQSQRREGSSTAKQRRLRSSRRSTLDCPPSCSSISSRRRRWGRRSVAEPGGAMAAAAAALLRQRGESSPPPQLLLPQLKLPWHAAQRRLVLLR